MASTQFALPPAPAPTRPRVLMVATAFGVTAAAVLFVTLVGVYLTLRAEAGGTAEWLPEGVSLPLVPANMALITLLMSSVSIQWAITAMGRNDRKHAYLALGLTLLFGLAYINSAVFYVGQLGIGIGDGAYGVVVYAMYGTHIALAIASIVFLVATAFRALGGQYSPRDREGLAASAVAWHAMVAGYVLILATVVWLK